MYKIKYHPILFSTPMVQAIQENRKSQTRRTKGLEEINEAPDNWNFLGFEYNPINNDDKNRWAYFKMKDADSWMYVDCPYNIGDVLWVRENFHYIHDSDTNVFLKYGYQADYNYKGAKWKPSIHMPKVACRIFLKIKSIRVERLRDIFHSEARFEGVDFVKGINGNLYYNYLTLDYGCNELFSFMTLWQKINGEDSWEFNPWVFVYDFEQIEKPLDFIV